MQRELGVLCDLSSILMERREDRIIRLRIFIGSKLNILFYRCLRIY